jgi:hypothetical protein
MHAICTRQVQLARDVGVLADLSFHLAQLGMACQWMGDFAGTELLVAEEAIIAAATGSPIASYTLLRLRAAAAEEQGMAAMYAHWAAAVLYNGLARLKGVLIQIMPLTWDSFLLPVMDGHRRLTHDLIGSTSGLRPGSLSKT